MTITSATRPARSLGRARFRRLLLSLVVLLLSMALAEGAWRGVLAWRGQPYRAEDVRAEIQQYASPARLPGTSNSPATPGEPDPATKILNAYLGWTDVATIRQIESDRPYFRGTECDQTFDVFVMGGSTAYDMAKMAGEHLRARIAADPRFRDRPVRIFNYCKSGYRQPQPVNFLTWLLALGFKPDAVIVLDGFNEVTFGASNALNGVSPIQPYAYIFGALASRQELDSVGLDLLVAVRGAEQHERSSGQRCLDMGLERSAIAGHFVRSRLATLHGRTVALHERWAAYLRDRTRALSVRGPTFDADPEAVAQETTNCWYEGSLAFAGICDARGVPYVHLLQPTLLDKGSKPATEEEIAKCSALDGWADGVRFAYPLMRAAGARLRLKGVNFVDATALLRDVTETVYTDACHMLPRGMELVADEAARALLEHLPVR